LRLLEDADLARGLGDAGHRRALQDFSPARMVERYAALYRELIGS
jgi:glycosyltransferase involved in cell wall biosynthesis